ncbi:MAG TPA: hypothetical protein PKH94_07250 [Bacteroidales bacterium]|nr:hypothetical protein [Bacteroidales bacterium]HNS47018.1 hypothetical protein [Bacteroidales bacterium]
MLNRSFIIRSFQVFFFLLIPGMFMISCNKEEITTNPSVKLTFSADTVVFDTVFATIGTTTRYLMVYNNDKNRVKIASVRLAGGSGSPFELNIDGVPSIQLRDVEIPANDSLFIFIRVTVDPTNENNPFLVTDSIVFETNGNVQDIDLVAYGQNAHFYTNAVYQMHGMWANDKPHVVYGFVIIDSSYSLTIQPGSRVYFHKDAILAVANEATLKIAGTFDAPVTFQGDRLDEDLQELPGQWGTIWLTAGSKNNEIDHAIIRNAVIGIRVDTLGSSPQPTLKLSNTQILNMSGYGLQALGSHVVAANCVIANCAETAVFLGIGGTYDFRHCTIGNYYPYTARQTASLVLTNFYLLLDDMGHVKDTIARDLNQAYFGNCIVYGNKTEEIALASTSLAQFNYLFDHCLLRTTRIADPFIAGCVFNEDPLFSDYETNDYTLDTILSPAVDAGLMDIINTSVLNLVNDLNNNNRTLDGKPDLGAYELIRR